MNTDVGLPLTVIGATNAWKSVSGWLRNLSLGAGLIFRRSEYPDILVLEVGADHPGDISRIARWLRPDISVITQVSETPVHVEFFDSPEAVFEEKASLAAAVKKGGTLVLFADNEKVLSLKERVKGMNVNVISFGLNEKADIVGSDYRMAYRTDEQSKAISGFTFQLASGGTSVLVSAHNILGQSYMYPLLAATAVGTARGIALPTIVDGLNAYDAPKSRMRIIDGINGSMLIDDTYNSSPDAVVSALKAMKDLDCSGSKIAVLGDMLELGQYASEQHRRIGREVIGVVDRLVTVGQRSKSTADEAVGNGFPLAMIQSVDTPDEAGKYVKSIIKTGDVVLIKGSQSIRLERVVGMLMRDPEQATQLLVRQEPEWLAKK